MPRIQYITLHPEHVRDPKISVLKNKTKKKKEEKRTAQQSLGRGRIPEKIWVRKERGMMREDGQNVIYTYEIFVK